MKNTLEGRILSGVFLLLFIVYLSIFVSFGLRFRRFHKSLHEQISKRSLFYKKSRRIPWKLFFTPVK